MTGIPSEVVTKAYTKGVQAIAERAKSQADRFREAARAAECDDDEARFNQNLRKIAKAKPKDEKPAKE